MPARRRELLRQIQRLALMDQADLAKILRLCIAYGGEARSPTLRDWASHELNGYGAGELPEYRRIGAPLFLKAVVHGAVGPPQRPPFGLIPDDLGLDDFMEYGGGVAQIREAISSARRQHEDIVRLSVPGHDQLLGILNHQLSQLDRDQGSRRMMGLPPSQRIFEIYRQVHLSSLAAILDGVRTNVVSLTAELLESPQTEENPAAVEQSVKFVVFGVGNRVSFQTANAGGDVTQVANSNVSDGPEPEGILRRWMFWAVGAATIIAAVPALAAWLT